MNKKSRGRPKTGLALTPAQKQAAYRQRCAQKTLIFNDSPPDVVDTASTRALILSDALDDLTDKQFLLVKKMLLELKTVPRDSLYAMYKNIDKQLKSLDVNYEMILDVETLYLYAAHDAMINGH